MVLSKIKTYLDFKGISIGTFEKSVGMSNASFRKTLASGKGIGSDKLENILRKYTDISTEWLFRDKGSMLLGETDDNRNGTNTICNSSLVAAERMSYLEKMVEEKEREIQDKERTIQILLAKQ